MLHKKLRLLLVLALMVTGVFAVQAQDDEDDPDAVTFQSTQFNIVEESEIAREILSAFEGAINFVTTEEGPLIDILIAEGQSGSGSTDLVGALHGTFPSLVRNDLLFDLTELTAELDEMYNIADAFIELGLMGTTDYQYYVPWMQATYVMAANVEALEYLPEGADLNALTWDELAEWGVNMAEADGENRLGLPVAGLFNRFMQGYLFPSFTGGMVTEFRSEAAVEMMEFMRDVLWPVVNQESINYAFMNEPLLSGEVWVAFDHVARLGPAFAAMVDGDTDKEFVAFPAPAGPAGRGFMPVVVGLGIPFTAPNPDGAEELLAYMLSPEVQLQVLSELNFFPVVDGVDFDALPENVALIAAAVSAQSAAEDALPALLPVGLGDRGGEINQIFNNVFSRIVQGGEDIQAVLDSEGENLSNLLSETGAACWPPDAPSEGACEVN
ncbi:MAG: extracellular solute-binding protein [Anaerolineaceae bacterium]|nr:MAG: extracellular solute-binding protein [Anaerolineaceae bacterium]